MRRGELELMVPMVLTEEWEARDPWLVILHPILLLLVSLDACCCCVVIVVCC